MWSAYNVSDLYCILKALKDFHSCLWILQGQIEVWLWPQNPLNIIVVFKSG